LSALPSDGAPDPAPDAGIDAGESLVVRCATHPNVETGLRCGRCETPICPRCLVMTPVGAKCRECARLKPLPIFVAGPKHLAIALGVALATGLVGSVVMLFGSRFGLLALLLAALVGYGVGEAVSWATNRKRATAIAIIATAGAAAPMFVVLIVLGNPLFAALSAGVAGFVAWQRFR
jgi:hypothetical protein